MSGTKRVLVTGATGFVGRYVLEPLHERGYEIHMATRHPSTEFPAYVVSHQLDLLDCSTHLPLLELVRPSHLLHAAWYAEHGKYWEAVENVSWLKATLSLVEAFCHAGGRRALGVGSCAEYDWQYGMLVENETPQRPLSLYGSAKVAAGHHAAVVAGAHGVEFAWARIFFPYGPGEPESRLIPHVITSLLRGEPARCTHGRQFRDFLYVADVGDALAAVLDSPACGAINIGSGLPVTIGDVAMRIGSALGRPELVLLGAIPESTQSARMVLASTVRLTDEIGWVPKHAMDEGLTKSIEWWRTARPHERT